MPLQRRHTQFFGYPVPREAAIFAGGYMNGLRTKYELPLNPAKVIQWFSVSKTTLTKAGNGVS